LFFVPGIQALCLGPRAVFKGHDFIKEQSTKLKVQGRLIAQFVRPSGR
jgi:hypothetical protein